MLTKDALTINLQGRNYYFTNLAKVNVRVATAQGKQGIWLLTLYSALATSC